MHDVHDPGAHHLIVQQRLKDSFTLVYMTILSVIQGVALADLASVVAFHYQQFTSIHYLLVLINFGVLIEVWSLYTMNTTIWDWIPDMRDAGLPFVIGALELLLNHMIPLSLSAWLLISGVIGGMAALALWHMDWRARGEDENVLLLRLLRKRLHVFEFYCLGASILVLLLAVGSQLGGLQASEGWQTGRGLLALLIVLLVGAGLISLGMMTVWYWQVVVAYARTGHMLGRHQT